MYTSDCEYEAIPLHIVHKREFETQVSPSLQFEQKHVFLMGALPAVEMPKYFSCVDGLIVSLKKSDIFSKTIPGKLQSYLACGKPIIGSLDGIGAIIINDAKCGFTANAESVEGLVKAIINLYNSSQK